MYLRPNAVIEPLVDGWYAWPHLISPATAARNLTHRHVPIMESFLAAPQIHADAVRSPALLGGPFMDVAPARAGAVAELLGRTIARRAPQIAFSRALDELAGMLAERADGQSLEPLYARVPAPLDGAVELVYDLSDRASYRLIEPLLYRSELYDPSAQSVRFSVLESDHRPFIFSTPRLADDRDVHLEVPFAHGGLDRLFASARTGCELGKLKEALGWPDALDAGLRALFQTAPPPPALRYRGAGVRWRYCGHACVLIETAATTILLDPVLGHRLAGGPTRHSYDDLPERIDLVLLSHNHQDHVLLETLLRLRHRIGTVVVPRSGHGALHDPSLRLMLEAIGFPRVVELGEFDQLALEDGAVTALPFLGEHGDLDIAAKLGWRVMLRGRHLVFAADSCNLSPALYRRIHAAIGDVDVLFLGMECDGAPLSWVYGPLYPRPLPRQRDTSRRLSGCDHPRALQLVSALRCEQVFVYAMGQEPWLEYLVAKHYTAASRPITESDRLIEDCRAAGLTAERLFGEKTAELEPVV